jgi:hypothetical protein
MHKTNPTEFLAMHAIATLPDSTAARKRLLGAITGALPRNNETRLTAQAILHAMKQQDELQERLAFNFAQLSGGAQ